MDLETESKVKELYSSIVFRWMKRPGIVNWRRPPDFWVVGDVVREDSSIRILEGTVWFIGRVIVVVMSI